MRAVRTLLLTAFLAVGALTGTASATVTQTSSMATARSGHVAVALPTTDGTVQKILVTGGTTTGTNTGATASTEIYDVASGTWAPAANLPTAQTDPYAVPLRASAGHPQGRVFVIGGIDTTGGIVIAPQLYDVATNTWSTITGTFFQLTPTRTQMTVSVAGDRVILAGGLSSQGVVVNSIEVFDSLTDARVTNPTVAPMAVARRAHAATVLADGRVLFSGGSSGVNPGDPSLTSAELFDPLAPAGGAVLTAPMTTARALHTASLVDPERVLVAGGATTPGGAPLATSESWSPITNTWTSGGSMAAPRIGQEATVVRSGWLAITGGTATNDPVAPGLDSAESWTPGTTWSGLYGLGGTEPIGGGRALHTATAIPQSDELLIAGGNTPPTATAVRYSPNRPAPTPTPTPVATPAQPAAPTPTPTPTTPGTPPTPVQNVSVAVTPVSGTVYVRIGTTDEYRELRAGEVIPTGTVLDTTDGRVRLTSISGGKLQTAEFYGGTFRVLQPKGEGGIVEVRIVGRPKCATKKATATAAVKRKSKPRVWGDGKGRFRTRGANSSATVRGTKWLVEERCTGTFTRVARGIVAVRDFRRHRTVLVKASRTYLAKPPTR